LFQTSCSNGDFPTVNQKEPEKALTMALALADKTNAISLLVLIVDRLGIAVRNNEGQMTLNGNRF
jgi:hypothetical protein